jgi:hypothetical protein
MTGSCWRLLAFFLLILVAPTFLRGQDSPDRSPASAPATAPVLAPNLATPRFSPPIAPVWIPPPSAPRRYPGGRDPVAPAPIIFQQLVRAAGIIFSGRVTAIGRAPSSSGQVSNSTITFLVEHAMRGAAPGQSLTIHEWAGLWSRGEHYRVGERVLLFLYSTGKLGLTSPVAGGLGRFAMDSQGRIRMSAQDVAALAADPILGGKTVVPYAEFAQAVRRSSREE